MPTTAGFILSTILGLAARRIQVQIVGRRFAALWDRVPGYALLASAFIGGYLVCDHFIERNRALLGRRLAQLSAQRAELAAFHEFDLGADHRFTAQRRTSLFSNILDSFGKDYK